MAHLQGEGWRVNWQEMLVGAIVGGSITQALNAWKVYPRLAVIDNRLKSLEDKFEDIAHYRINRNSSSGGST